MMAWLSLFIATLMILSVSTKPTFSISNQSHEPTLPPDQFILPMSSNSSIILLSDPFIFNSATSLSSIFTFEIRNGVSLVLFPADFPSNFSPNISFQLLHANQFLGIEFYANVCKISSSRVRNISKNSNVLKDGVKLSSWVAYSAISKWLNVSLSKLGDPMPVEPLISHRIDLVEVLKGEKVLLGLASNENVYAWRSKIKDSDEWVTVSGSHSPKDSVPVLPQELSTSNEEGGRFSGLMFATGCGVLGGLVTFVLFLYVVVRLKVQGPVDFRFEKIDALEVKNSETTMK